MATSMHDLWEKYQNYVKSNPTAVSQIEGLTRVLSYIIPAKFDTSSVFAELLYSASNLLVLLNDTIIRNATRASKTISAAHHPQLRTWLSVLESLEVFLEMGAERAGGPTLHWIVVVCIQIFKTVVRLILLKMNPEGLQSTPIIPPMDRKAELVKLMMEDSAVFGQRVPEMSSPTFTLKSSGRAIRKLAASPPFEQRTWKLPERDATERPTSEPTKLNSMQQLAEGMYISRPLIHLIAMYLYGHRSWKPWLLASGIDTSSLYLMGKRNSFNDLEQAELARRTTMLFFYMLRSPFYDTFTKKRLIRTLGTLAKNIPLVHVVINPLIEYLPVWQKIYFHVWNQ